MQLRRRPDGSLADGPTGLRCALGRLVVSPSAYRRAQMMREDQQAAAERVAAVRSRMERQSGGVEVRAVKAHQTLTVQTVAPHPRQCRKLVRVVGVKR